MFIAVIGTLVNAIVDIFRNVFGFCYVDTLVADRSWAR
jgi:hypothetical protein